VKQTWQYQRSIVYIRGPIVPGFFGVTKLNRIGATRFVQLRTQTPFSRDKKLNLQESLFALVIYLIGAYKIQ
jgi:hypothetical protein